MAHQRKDSDEIEEVREEIVCLMNKKKEEEDAREMKRIPRHLGEEHGWWKIIQTKPKENQKMTYGNETVINDSLKDHIIMHNFAEIYGAHPFINTEQCCVLQELCDWMIAPEKDEEEYTYDTSFLQEVMVKGIKKKRNDTSSGLDVISWKQAKALNSAILTKPAIWAITHGIVPDKIKLNKTIGIPKKDGSSRFIRTQSIDSALFDIGLHGCIHREGIRIEPTQGGCAGTNEVNGGTLIQLLTQRLILEITLLLCLSIYLCIADLDKAFDRCVTSLLIIQYKEEQHTPLPLLRLKNELNKNNHNIVFNKGRAIARFRSLIGVPQGGTYSCTDYGIATN
eukprot:324173_1